MTRKELDEIAKGIRAKLGDSVVDAQIARSEKAKKGKSGRPPKTTKSPFEEMVQELAKNAGIATSNEPAAPAGVGTAARPNNAPRAGMSTLQQAVAQVNANAQAAASSIPQIAPSNPLFIPMGTLQRKDRWQNLQYQVAGGVVNHGFQYAQPPPSKKGLSVPNVSNVSGPPPVRAGYERVYRTDNPHNINIPSDKDMHPAERDFKYIRDWRNANAPGMPVMYVDVPQLDYYGRPIIAGGNAADIVGRVGYITNAERRQLRIFPEEGRAPFPGKGTDSPDVIRDTFLKEGMSFAKSEARSYDTARKFDQMIERKAQKAVDKTIREGIREAIRGRKFMSKIYDKAARMSEAPVDMQDGNDIGNLDAFNNMSARIGKERSHNSFWNWRTRFDKPGGIMGRNLYAINRAFHAIQMVASSLENAHAINDPQNQIDPGINMFNQVAHQVPGTVGMAMRAVGIGLEIYSNRQKSENMSVNAGLDVALAAVGFGNDRMYASIKNRGEKARDAGNRTYWEGLKAEFGITGALDEQYANRVLGEMSSYQHARGEAYLYGNEAQRGLAEWAITHNRSMNDIPEIARNEIIDRAIDKRRQKIQSSKGFQDAIDAEMPFWAYGQEFSWLRDNLENSKLNDIMNGKIEVYGDNIKTDARLRKEVDRTVADYMRNYEFNTKQQDELSRNIELKYKAERHRHLAEF